MDIVIIGGAEFEVVTLSLCHKAPIVQGLRFPATPTSPAEYDDICEECGLFTDAVEFFRSLWDGTLIEVV